MIIHDNETLRELTGSWYASNDFSLIKTDIELETEDLIKIVGNDIVEKAEGIAVKAEKTAEELVLLKRVQLPIALMAVYRYFQSNIVSHDQSSRKVTLSNDEKMAWEWMLDRDDAAHLTKAQRAVDRLIAYLDKTDPAEWRDSSNKQAAKKLFVNNTEVFGEYYSIDNSARFYYLAVPMLREVQNNAIKDALGKDYKPLLSNFQDGDLTEYQEELLDLTRRAQVLATLALAVRRLNTKVLPDGIAKTLKSEGQTSNASRPANLDEVAYFSKRLDEDAMTFIDKIKRKRYENDPAYLDYQLLPKNDPDQKFART